MMLVRSAGVERDCAAETCVEAGPMMLAFSAGAVRARSLATFGAGAMMLRFKAGATNLCSDWTLGAGGTTAEFRVGALRGLLLATLGAGGTMEPSVTPPRD